MKKYLIGILLIIIAVVSVSGCLSGTSDEVKNLTVNNVSFSYPSTWVEALSMDNNTIAAVGLPSSVDPNTKTAKVSVSIQTQKYSRGFDYFFIDNYESLFADTTYKKISEGNVTIGHYSGLETTYTNTATKMKYRAIWINGNGTTYVILCAAPESEFDSHTADFETVFNSFKIL